MQTGRGKRSFPRKKVLLGLVILMIVAVSVGYAWVHSQLGPPAGYSALMRAIEHRDPDSVDALLKSGVSPNSFPHTKLAVMFDHNTPPLLVAASLGNLRIVSLLLDHGADINQGDNWDSSPLVVAGSETRLDVMKLLVERGAKVNDRPGGSTALWELAMDKKGKSVSFLLSHGANPNTYFRDPNDRLIPALKKQEGTERIIQILRAAGGKE